MKKRLINALAISLLLGGSLAATSCGSKTEEPPVQQEVTITKLEVKTPPTKATYIEGEKFQKSGLVLLATYSDKTVEEVKAASIKIKETGNLTAGTTSVTAVYKTAEVKVPITVNAMVVESITISKTPTSVLFAAGANYDFSGLEVTAKINGEDKVLAEDEYVLKVGTTVIKNGDKIELNSGEHTVEVSYKDKTASFKINVIKGYKIESENISFGEPAKDATTYVRIKNKTTDEGYITEPNGNGSIRAITDDSASLASGNSYLGDIKKGNIIDFYFKSDVAQKATVSICAASGYLTLDDGNWGPLEMGDMKIKDALKATANDKEIVISDEVILPGKKSETVDPSLWTNWQNVSFGELDVKPGINLISIEITSELINCKGSPCAFNLDFIEVRFGE